MSPPPRSEALFDALLSELQSAHELLRIALNCMGRREQELFAAASEAAQLGTDGASRHHERADVIARAVALRDAQVLAAECSTVRTGPRRDGADTDSPNAGLPQPGQASSFAQACAELQAQHARLGLIQASHSAGEPLRSELLAAVSSLPSLG